MLTVIAFWLVASILVAAGLAVSAARRPAMRPGTARIPVQRVGQHDDATWSSPDVQPW